MALKFFWYWRGYEASNFKPHGDAFLFRLPPFPKTYLVTADQREHLAGRLRRISTIETYTALTFDCGALALCVIALLPGVNGWTLVYGLLGAFIALAMSTLVHRFMLVLRYFSLRRELKRLQVSNEKFTRADRQRNRATLMPKLRFIFEIAALVYLNAMIVVSFILVVGNPMDLVRDFYPGRTVQLFFAIVLPLALVSGVWGLWKLIRFRRLSARNDSLAGLRFADE